MTLCSLRDFAPWPLEELRDRLCSGDVLWELCRSKSSGERSRASREKILEQVGLDVLRTTFGSANARGPQRLADTLGLPADGFLPTRQVDLACFSGGRWHLCEVKSSRVDYSRHHGEVGAEARRWFESVGFPVKSLNEVEQDLVRLLHFPSVSPLVGSCLLIMVDAFQRDSGLWQRRLTDQATFSEFMRSPWVREASQRLTAATAVVPLRSETMTATMIVCEVHPA